MIHCDSLLQNATDITKCESLFYYKMRQFYYKVRQGFLLQNLTLLLQNVMFITNCGSTINHNITAWMKAP